MVVGNDSSRPTLEEVRDEFEQQVGDGLRRAVGALGLADAATVATFLEEQLLDRAGAGFFDFPVLQLETIRIIHFLSCLFS